MEVDIPSSNPFAVDLDAPVTTNPPGILDYGDYQPCQRPMGSIQQSLSENAQLAANRAREGEALFSSLAILLDQQCASISQGNLPAKQARALQDCASELAHVVSKHFNAYAQAVTPQKSRPSIPMSTKPVTTSTYASAANRTRRTPTSAPTAKQQNYQGPKKQVTGKSIETRKDNRLFVRLPPNSALRGSSGYALQAHIKARLGDHGNLLNNVLPTNSGFALCPSTGNTDALTEKISTASLLGDAPIEKASPWTSFRIENVLQNFGTINDKLQYCLQPVSLEAVSDALKAAVGTTPVDVKPSQDNEQNVNSPSSTWIARFPEEHNRLPRVLYLFGCRTSVRLLPRRVTTVQCSKCRL